MKLIFISLFRYTLCIHLIPWTYFLWQGQLILLHIYHLYDNDVDVHSKHALVGWDILTVEAAGVQWAVQETNLF